MAIFWAIIAIGSNVIQFILKRNGAGDDVHINVEFNIIGCLTACSLIYCFLQKRSWKALLAAFLISFLLSTYFVPSLRNGLYNVFGGYTSRRIGAAYNIPYIYMIPLWEYPVQGDYTPLFPFLVFFLGGTLVSAFFYREKKKSYFPKREWERPICFIGRHTLLIYLAHFLIIRGIFVIANVIMYGAFY